MAAIKGEKGAPPFPVLRECFAAGSCTALSAAVFNPTDICKIRMQTEAMLISQTTQAQYTSVTATAKKILAEEGIWGLWRPGITASCLRDLGYTGLRVGLYPSVKQGLSKAAGLGADDMGFFFKMVCGMSTGALGAALATPPDLVKIRMQGEAGRIQDGKFVTGLRKGHVPEIRNTYDGFVQIVRKDGVSGLYRGLYAGVIRAAIGTGAQLATYDHAKCALKAYNIPLFHEEGPPLHLFAAFLSGLAFSTASAPADLIKSRMMNDTTGYYRNNLDCLLRTVRGEGPAALFKGWTPSVLRLCPMFMVATTLMEQARFVLGLSWF